MNRLPTTGKLARSIYAATIMFLAPTAAALAQSESTDFGGVLWIWGGILVVGGIVSAVAMVAVSGRMGKR